MSKNQLFYRSDNESTPSIPPNSIPLNSPPQILSSPFLKPKVPLVTRYAKINKIKKPTNKPSAHHKNKTNKETNRTASKNGSIWDLTNVASNKFTQEFKIDKSGIRMKDYKWGPISSNLVEIALQPWINNMYDSISSGLSEYSKKIDNFLPKVHQDQVGVMKQKLIGDIVKQIRKQLHKCVFPNDTNDIIRNDIDPEYIFAKRKHIQSLIDNMTKEVHLLKEELKKESNQLNEAKNFIRNLKRTNDQLLKQNLLDQTLHPLVNKVLQNEYGLIKIDQLSKLNNNNNNEKKEEEEGEGEGENEDIILKYAGPMRRNIATYNLIISTDLAVNDDNNNNDQYEIVADSLPSLTQLNEFIPSMTKIIDRILSTKQNKQLQELFPA
ncbi:Okp1p PWA37_001798 [Arxiozyma heterogenica]|uniref:Uncharacterized protein n=1 Tax=Arxiozyma heterogenica TaxID=278026 RepID=A0AAN7WGX6_9SACH|nr:hypothetical protein RI543_002379 [Kazachstania heterogenica]